MKGMSLLASARLIVGLLLSACAPAAPAPVPTVPAATPKLVVSTPSALAAIPTATPTSKPVSPTPVLQAMPTLAPTPGVVKPRYGSVLNLLARESARDYDIHQTRIFAVQQPLAPAYSLLVQNDPSDETDTKIIPDLADRWEASSDGKTYTFHIRKGVKFHDGTALTAADVKASFERIAWPPKGVLGPRAEQFKAVTKIEIPDDYTVGFYLKYPQASFLQMVAIGFNVVYPKYILDKKGDMKQDVIGTGPFKLKEHMRDVSMALVKNPDYYIPERPYLDGITWYVIKDMAAVTSAIRTGRLHMIWGVQHTMSPGEREILAKEVPGLIMKSRPSTQYQWFTTHTKRAPWTDVRVRRAVDLVVDRDAYVKIVWRGDVEVGGHMFPGFWSIPKEELLKMPGYRQPKDQDIAEAKRLLAEAGYARGFKTSILARAQPQYQDQAVFLKGELAKISIDADLQILETGAFNNRLYDHNFDTVGYAATMAAPDPDVIFAEMYTSTAFGNYGEYENPTLDELFLKQAQTLDPAERKRLVLEMQNILHRDAVRTALGWTKWNLISWPEVRDFYLHSSWSMGGKLENIWLTR